MNLSMPTNAIKESLINNFDLFLMFLPKIVGAILLLILGLICGRLAATGLKYFLNYIGTDRLISESGILSFLHTPGRHQPVSQMISTVIYWVIFFLFLISATEVLGLALLSQSLTGLAVYLPKIGLAVLILILGLVGTNWIRELVALACQSAGIRQGPVIAQTIFVAATLLVLVTALNELGIDTSLLNQIIVLLVAGLVAGAALSFGFGARSAVRNLIAAHYIQPIIRIGDHIEVGQHRGTITGVTPLLVIMETERGRVALPATQFTETATVIDAPLGGS